MYSFFKKPLSQIYYWIAFLTVIPALQTIAAPTAFLAFPSLILDIQFSVIIIGVFILHSLIPLAGILLLLFKKMAGLLCCALGWLAFIVRNIVIGATYQQIASDAVPTTEIWTYTALAGVLGAIMIGYIIWIIKQELRPSTPVEAALHQ